MPSIIGILSYTFLIFWLPPSTLNSSALRELGIDANASAKKVTQAFYLQDHDLENGIFPLLQSMP